MSLVVAGSLWACTDETTFTEEERNIFSSYRLPDQAPPNPSNMYADDRRAAVLGKKFFFDGRFSGVLGSVNGDGKLNGSLGPAGTSGKVSCYACHQIEAGGADRRSRPGTTSLGVNYGVRNSPTVINVAFSDVTNGGWQLWDGRKDSLWAQALGPMEGPNEHAGTRLQYAHIIFDYYRAEYEAIFGLMPDLNALNQSGIPRFPTSGKPGDMGNFDNMAADDKVVINRIYANLGKSIEAYERLLISPNFEPSPFDKMLAGNDSAMSPAAVRGAKLFIGKAACDECHRGAMFTDYKFHNIGCPQEGLNVPVIDLGRTKGFDIVKGDVFNRSKAFSDAPDSAHLDSLPLPTEEDKLALSVGAFKTPTLRNIEKTAPFMHNGVYTNLWDVVSHYNFGGGTGTFSGTKESAVSPLLLTNDELDDLVEFLRSLSDGPPLDMSEDFPEGLVGMPDLP